LQKTLAVRVIYEQNSSGFSCPLIDWVGTCNLFQTGEIANRYWESFR
jgi:hypothetical protein